MHASFSPFFKMLIAIGLAIATIGPRAAAAQTFRGAIRGEVIDPSDQVVPGAAVIAEHTATRVRRTTAANEQGRFVFQDLPVGTYRLEVTAPGFELAAIEIAVAVGSVADVPVRLSVAKATEAVTVEASALRLDSSTPTLLTVVPPRAIQEMPLNGRDFTQLIKLAAGTNGAGSINGSRTQQNNYQIDGIDNNNLFFNSQAVNQGGVGLIGFQGTIAATLLPLDAIDQFSVTSHGTAEYGRNPGGAINVAVKSGTNDRHGSLYYFHRGDALAEAPPFATVRPGLQNNQFGGSIGGPAIKNRLFYFGSYERQRLRVGNVSPATEPSQAYVSAAEQVLARYGVAVNPVTKNLLEFWPARGRTGPASAGNFVSGDDAVFRSDNGIVKVDYALAANQTLALRYFTGRGFQAAPSAPGIAYYDYYQSVPTRVHNAGVTYTNAISPRLLNQVLIGANSLSQVYVDSNTAFDPIAAGLNTGVTSPLLAGSPDLLISGFENIGRTPTLGRKTSSVQIGDTLTFIAGRHEIRAGFEYRREFGDVFYERNKRGTFRFDGSRGPWATDPSLTDPNLKSLSDFLAGYVSTSSITRGTLQRDWRRDGFDTFVQDAFRVSRALSLTLGLRYAYARPFSDTRDSVSTFVPGQGILFVGDQLDSLWPRDRNNVAPRIGVAFSPGGRPRFTIRGSYGLYYDLPNLSMFVDNRPSNGGTQGAQANPAGPDPVFTVNRTAYTIVANEPIFGSAPTPPYSVFSVSQDFRDAYVHEVNTSVQYQFVPSMRLQVAYVGSFGRNLPVSLDINQAAPAATGTRTTSAAAQATRPFAAAFPTYSVINQIASAARSNYHGLQTSLAVRSWRRVTAQVAYTYGHAKDNASTGRAASPANSFDLENEYGDSDFDIRHTVNAFAIYDVPAMPRAPAWLGTGWQVNALVSAYSGPPLTVLYGQNISGTFEGRDRVDVIGDPYAGLDRTLKNGYVQWLNPAAFAAPAPGTFGNERRNQFRGPGFGTVDLGVIKQTRLPGSVSMQLRLEIFNLFNRTNLAAPVTTLTSGSFGRITNTLSAANFAPGIGSGEPRNVQLAFKFLF